MADAVLSGYLAQTQAALAAIKTLVGASRDQINTILVPLTAAQDRVRVLLSEEEPIIDGAFSVGDVAPALGFGQSAANLIEQQDGFSQVLSLYELAATLGRMATNLSADGVSGRIITLAGGDLYHLAAVVYGDAEAWPAIARANDLVDPDIIGVQDLTIPPNPGGLDGILAP